MIYMVFSSLIYYIVLAPRNMDLQSVFEHKGCGSKSDVCESSNVKKNFDVIIVGAGVAGSALAYTLAKDGRHVHLIERNLSEPNRFAGEALQPGGYLKLLELGLEDCLSGIDSQMVYGYEVYNEGRSVTVPYPLENFRFDVAGRCFHNGRFVQSLRCKASSLPNVELEQGTVTSLVKARGKIMGVEYKTKSGDKFTSYAPLTIICDGCHSSLRRFLCLPKVKELSYFVALLLENCELPNKNHSHVILGDNPMVFYPISSTEVRFLIDLPHQKLPSIANGDMARQLKAFTHQVPVKLRDALFAAIEKGQIRTQEAKCMTAMAYPTPGALLLGDSLSMRHPITGTGMTAALHDIVLIRDLLRPLQNLNDMSTLSKKIKRFYTLRKPVAFTLNTVANVSYKSVHADPDGANKEYSRMFFNYLKLGGYFSRWVALSISGIDPSLLTHAITSFPLTVYVTISFLVQFPSPKRICSFFKLFMEMILIVRDNIREDVEQEFLLANGQGHEE